MADPMREDLVLGKYVGNILESLPINSRGRAIREIKAVEEKYSEALEEHCGDQPSLSLQLLRIEHHKMAPRIQAGPVMRWKNVPKNYGEAVEGYLESIPLSYRAKAFKKIHNIVSSYAAEFHNGGS